jgi:hypothetical protein
MEQPKLLETKHDRKHEYLKRVLILFESKFWKGLWVIVDKDKGIVNLRFILKMVELNTKCSIYIWTSNSCNYKIKLKPK